MPTCTGSSRHGQAAMGVARGGTREGDAVRNDTAADSSCGCGWYSHEPAVRAACTRLVRPAASHASTGVRPSLLRLVPRRASGGEGS
eukprot:scaffold99642_cov63-Phaeocystis_antarctica.AAC.1